MNFMSRKLLRIVSSFKLEEYVNGRQLGTHCTLESSHTLEWEPGLPGPFGVESTGVCSCLNHVRGVAGLKDIVNLLPPTSETSPEWESLIIEGTHHFTEARLQSIGFPFIYRLDTLSNIQIYSFLLIVTGLWVSGISGRGQKRNPFWDGSIEPQ